MSEPGESAFVDIVSMAWRLICFAIAVGREDRNDGDTALQLRVPLPFYRRPFRP